MSTREVTRQLHSHGQGTVARSRITELSCQIEHFYFVLRSMDHLLRQGPIGRSSSRRRTIQPQLSFYFRPCHKCRGPTAVSTSKRQPFVHDFVICQMLVSVAVCVWLAALLISCFACSYLSVCKVFALTESRQLRVDPAQGDAGYAKSRAGRDDDSAVLK